ncbi:PfkB family carbohydrate kinase [Hasllibacter sp. MH4015]|uniref:PfkB family carbohydrate kinase n=1 Tax=Hasllibacter sp. MH4015 TaxID=2854029 RepID=UPI001CD6E46B|nr:PfkB family carbohydrate kinase [Hasllibacter sp. MH4015]
MAKTPDILCIGAVLWDIIGRSPSVMREGSDVPGRITRLPGGVALNIAMALKGFGLSPALLTVVGQDEEGAELIRACDALGLITDHIYRSADLPTDRYMAVEGANGLIAAIADAHSLEAAGAKILRPLERGTLGTDPFPGIVVLDGNLTVGLLTDIATRTHFAAADLRVAPASPGKALRLLPFLDATRATLYVNLEEAGLLLKAPQPDATKAALALRARGAHRVSVTNSGAEAAFAWDTHIVTATPPEVLVTRVTGAGDTFMAGHISAEHAGADPETALGTALRAAATYVSGETPF